MSGSSERADVQTITYGGRLYAIANADRFGVWLISLEHKDAVPFLAFKGKS